jgi:predicted kinase
MVPLSGVRWAGLGGKRDVLEGRLVRVAHQVLRAGGSVILDFGCWSSEERYALRAVADLAAADFALHHVTLPEDERRERATARWREAPEEVFEMTLDDHERFRLCSHHPRPTSSTAALLRRLRHRSRAGLPGLLPGGPRSRAWTSQR